MRRFVCPHCEESHFEITQLIDDAMKDGKYSLICTGCDTIFHTFDQSTIKDWRKINYD